MTLDRRTGLLAKAGRKHGIVEHARDGLLERGEIAGSDEAAVGAVLEVVAASDRRGSRHDGGLSARHRLQQCRCCPRVRVLTHGERNNTGAQQTRTDVAERHIHVHCDVRWGRPEHAGIVRRRDDAERSLVQTAREVEEQCEVPSRIGSDRDDVILGLRARVRAEVIGFDAERDELDPRAVVPEPGSQLVDLAPAVSDDRVEAPKRLAEESSCGRTAKLLEALRQTDRRVHHRRAHATEPTEKRERNADGVDSREDDVGTVQLAK